MSENKKKKLPASNEHTSVKTHPAEKEYIIEDTHHNLVNEPEAHYGEPINITTQNTMALMGLKPVQGYRRIKNDTDIIALIRTGIPKQAMNHLMEATDITITEMASIVHTSDRTLRRYQPDEKLPQEQSERMIELAGLYARGMEIFGNMENFKDWMNTQLIPLNNKKPKEFLDTSLGIRLLNDELGRIEHGIFA